MRHEPPLPVYAPDLNPVELAMEAGTPHAETVRVPQVSLATSRRTDGSPRLTVVLRRAGETCGRHRVARLRRVLRLRAKQERRFRPRTTDSRHRCPIAPNHLAERPPPSRPGEVWQADITCVATQEGWLYVAGLLDACSRKIVGWAGISRLLQSPDI